MADIFEVQVFFTFISRNPILWRKIFYFFCHLTVFFLTIFFRISTCYWSCMSHCYVNISCSVGEITATFFHFFTQFLIVYIYSIYSRTYSLWYTLWMCFLSIWRPSSIFSCPVNMLDNHMNFTTYFYFGDVHPHFVKISSKFLRNFICKDKVEEKWRRLSSLATFVNFFHYRRKKIT